MPNEVVFTLVWCLKRTWSGIQSALDIFKCVHELDSSSVGSISSVPFRFNFCVCLINRTQPKFSAMGRDKGQRVKGNLKVMQIFTLARTVERGQF